MGGWHARDSPHTSAAVPHAQKQLLLKTWERTMPRHDPAIQPRGARAIVLANNHVTQLLTLVQLQRSTLPTPLLSLSALQLARAIYVAKLVLSGINNTNANRLHHWFGVAWQIYPSQWRAGLRVAADCARPLVTAHLSDNLNAAILAAGDQGLVLAFDGASRPSSPPPVPTNHNVGFQQGRGATRTMCVNIRLGCACHRGVVRLTRCESALKA